MAVREKETVDDPERAIGTLIGSGDRIDLRDRRLGSSPSSATSRLSSRNSIR